MKKSILFIAMFLISTISYTADLENNKTKLDINDQNGKSHIVMVNKDTTVSLNDKPISVKLIDQIEDKAMIFIDTYHSLQRGNAYCASGEEQFLRVVSISNIPAKEIYTVKVASCLDNIEMMPSGIEWHSEESILKMAWLFGPSMKDKSEYRTIKIKHNTVEYIK